MIWDGIRCKRSKAFGWREGNPETDKDLRGSPVDSMYFVIVRIVDCPVVKKPDGREYYNAKGVKQAFPLQCGGTNYGYAKSKIVRNGQGRHVRVTRNGKSEIEWLCTYVKTPVYVVRGGHVYVGAVYRELRENEK